RVTCPIFDGATVLPVGVLAIYGICPEVIHFQESCLSHKKKLDNSLVSINCGIPHLP
ncbi:hypothetical protein CHS0354_042761, partial [Potamilus streckersoni]